MPTTSMKFNFRSWTYLTVPTYRTDKLIWFRRRIQLFDDSGSWSRSEFLMNYSLKFYSWKKFKFWPLWRSFKLYLCTVHRSLQSPKENIKHFKVWNFSTFFWIMSFYFLPGSGYGSIDPIESGPSLEMDLDKKHWFYHKSVFYPVLYQ